MRSRENIQEPYLRPYPVVVFFAAPVCVRIVLILTGRFFPLFFLFSSGGKWRLYCLIFPFRARHFPRLSLASQNF